MKGFDRLVAVVLCLMAATVVIANIVIAHHSESKDKLFRVEINRVEQELSNGRKIELDNYATILKVCEYSGDDFYDCKNEYAIRKINGTLYRIEYSENVGEFSELRILVNISFGVLLLLMLAAFFYVRKSIIKPFAKLRDLPSELAKGNLSIPLKECKSRYFGKFVWGLDMLRDELEQSKRRELDRVKSEKTFLLSLSHDIKTPLSAIKLYSKAISKGLYSGKRLTDSAESISAKADEIESYVNEMIGKLNDDFMNFDVEITMFYLSSVIGKICDYYADKFTLITTDFSIDEYIDCLISGDPNRLEEVMQNIIENAVKYGDGCEVSISFSEEEEHRLITVSNSGSTLSDSELSHIFDSFWRGSNTNGQQGSGLGLYICRRLMKAMEGDIFAANKNGCMSITVVCRKA